MKNLTKYLIIVCSLAIYSCEDTDLLGEKQQAEQIRQQEDLQITPANRDKDYWQTRQDDSEKYKSGHKAKKRKTKKSGRNGKKH